MKKEDTVIYGNLNVIREKIVQYVMTHDDLINFIYYKDTDTDITALPYLSKRERNKLINTKIFKRRRLPQTSEKADVLLSMEYGSRAYDGSRKISNMKFVAPKFVFYVVVHESLDETDNGSRLLAIEDCLLQLFHNQNIGTLGRSYVSHTEPTLCPQGYIGIAVTVKFTDFVGV